MVEKSNNEFLNNDFEQIIESYSDDELRNVLKKRKLYRKEAAEFAIQEAIKRELIYSEQDLYAGEFNHEQEKFSVFPAIENEKSRAKIINSITRSLLIVGVIPMILGGVKIFESQSLEGIIIFVFGAVWSITSFQLKRSLDIRLVYFMFALLLMLVGYLVKIFISYQSVNTMDIVFTAVAVGFILYGIGFLAKLRD